MNKDLLDKVNKLGFSMMEVEDTLSEPDVNKTLAEVVESHNVRLWEGFPALLVNAAYEKDFDHREVDQLLQNLTDKKCLRGLLLLSMALYKNRNLKFSWTKALKHFLADKTDVEAELKKFRDFLAGQNPFRVGDQSFSPQRLNVCFDRYVQTQAAKTKALQSKHEELSLEYALSQLFSPKQKELFFKKLNNEPLTKTEREYFSRTVKKKVLGLASPELHRLARRLLE